MAIRRAVVASLGAHGAVVLAALLWVGGENSRRSSATPATIALLNRTPSIEPPALATPIEIVVLPPEIARDGKRPRDVQRPRNDEATVNPRPGPQRSTEAGPARSPAVDVDPSRSPERSMRMRGADLRIGEALADQLVRDAKPLAEPQRSGKLRPAGRAFVVPDLVTTMHVGADGRASFTDKADGEVHLTLTPDRIGDHLARWWADPYAQTRYRAVQEMAPHEQAVPGGWDSGGGGDGGPSPGMDGGGGGGAIIKGSFDITAWAMRRFKVGDPYSSRKRKLLAQTFEERVELRREHDTRQLGRAAELMVRNVERLWRTTTDPATRREALFELWDECAEGEGLDGEAGTRARAIVIGAIRARLPTGSATGFTPAEITALDARRRSRQHFAP